MKNRTKVTLLGGGETDKLKPSTEEGSKIASTLAQTFLESIQGETLTPFTLMQALVEFFVGTTMALEDSGEVPESFRKILMRNVEMNFDYKDGQGAGIDLSDILLQGVIEDDEKGLLD